MGKTTFSLEAKEDNLFFASSSFWLPLVFLDVPWSVAIQYQSLLPWLHCLFFPMFSPLLSILTICSYLIRTMILSLLIRQLETFCSLLGNLYFNPQNKSVSDLLRTVPMPLLIHSYWHLTSQYFLVSAIRNLCSICFLKCLNILHFLAAWNYLLAPQFLHFFLPQFFGRQHVSVFLTFCIGLFVSIAASIRYNEDQDSHKFVGNMALQEG